MQPPPSSLTLSDKDYKMATKTKTVETEVVNPSSNGQAEANGQTTTTRQKNTPKKVKQRKCRYKTEVEKVEWYWQEFDYDGAVKFYNEHKGSNRPVGLGDVKSTAIKMINGEFAPTHQGIALDWNGKIIDGQHRLLAIKYAKEKLGCEDICVTIQVQTGYDPKTFECFDQGRLRKTADMFAIDGVHHYKVVEVAVRLHAIRYHGLNVKGARKMRIARMQDWLKAHPSLKSAALFIEEELAAEVPVSTYMSPGYATALYDLMRHSDIGLNEVETETIAQEFWYKFVGAENKEVVTNKRKSNSPGQCRNYFARIAKDPEKSLDRDAIVNYIISAWNTFVDNKQIKSINELKPKSGQRFTLTGCELDGDPEEVSKEEIAKWFG